MGWSIGYDTNWHRDIGYGVPAICDHPGCTEKIDRGLGYVCGGEPYGGADGCGLYFCSSHLWIDCHQPQRCERCSDGAEPFDAKPDIERWVRHKLTDESWQRWRDENPKEAAELAEAIDARPTRHDAGKSIGSADKDFSFYWDALRSPETTDHD